MSWHGALTLRYARRDGRTVVHDRHDGPLRILKSLYPEGDGICHNVLVHPPGGMVGGDSLAVDIALEAGAHALVTTPGATRFYRTTGEAAVQAVEVAVAASARLEWLPLETIAYDGCVAENSVRFALAAGAETIGWDLTALGLPASRAPFERGRFTQSIAIDGCWLDRGVVDGADRRLLDSPLGWHGRSVLATLWFAAGSPLAEARRETLLDAAREAAQTPAVASQVDGSATTPAPISGVTSPHAQVVVCRALAHRVEPAMALLRRIRLAWRRVAWQLDGCEPRVWLT